jgi:hypothetical protein
MAQIEIRTTSPLPNLQRTTVSNINMSHFGKFQFTLLSTEEQIKCLNRAKTFTDTDWQNEAVKLAKENIFANKYLILTVANYGFASFTKNWIANMLLRGYNKFLIVCTDGQLYSLLCQHGFGANAIMMPKHWFHTTLTIGEVIWEQPRYILLTQAKMFIAYKFLQVFI